MARGTQHLKKRPPGAQTRPKRDETSIRAQQRAERKAAEAGMFFPKLRTHAKWVFVLLALVFAGGFIFFGVGSGSNGIGNVLQDWLKIGQGSGGPSVSKLEAKTQKNPRDVQAWRDLATAYEAKQNHDGAARALERLSALQPKSSDTLIELAGQYQQQLQALSIEAQAAQAANPTVDTSSFQPPSTTALGKAFSDPTALQDPLTAALQSQVSSTFTELQTKAQGIQRSLLAADKKAVAIDPTNASAQFALAQVADSAGDTVTAVAAYKKFLQLSPDDPLAAQAKQRLKQLTATASSKSSSG